MGHGSMLLCSLSDRLCRSNQSMHLTSSAAPQSAINQFHIVSPAQAAALPAASPCPPAQSCNLHTRPPHI